MSKLLGYALGAILLYGAMINAHELKGRSPACVSLSPNRKDG